MIEFLNTVDRNLFLILNGLNSPFWDQIMWWISGRLSWIPLYLIIIAWLIYKFRWKAVVIIILAALLITMSDQGSVRLLKELVQRPRPCHDPEISQVVHLVKGHCGGEYGFVSAHAANTFALAAFTLMLIRKWYYTVFMILWASLVSYSRIYLGVHYPGDVIGGAVFGLLLGFLIYWIFLLVEKRTSGYFKKINSAGSTGRKD
jgi:undecaprenyl-diphosphatase